MKFQVKIYEIKKKKFEKDQFLSKSIWQIVKLHRQYMYGSQQLTRGATVTSWASLLISKFFDMSKELWYMGKTQEVTVPISSIVHSLARISKFFAHIRPILSDFHFQKLDSVLSLRIVKWYM